jgi:hypothetical protein
MLNSKARHGKGEVRVAEDEGCKNEKDYTDCDSNEEAERSFSSSDANKRFA